MGFVGPVDGCWALCVHIVWKRRPIVDETYFSSAGREMILRGASRLLALIMKHSPIFYNIHTLFIDLNILY